MVLLQFLFYIFSKHNGDIISEIYLKSIPLAFRRSGHLQLHISQKQIQTHDLSLNLYKVTFGSCRQKLFKITGVDQDRKRTGYSQNSKLTVCPKAETEQSWRRDSSGGLTTVTVSVHIPQDRNMTRKKKYIYMYLKNKQT